MTVSLAQVAGANARKLRLDAKVTLNELAAAVSSFGLPWTTGRVGALESGRVGPSLPTLYVVAAALGQTIGSPVSIVDLFAGEGEAAINDKLTVELSTLRAALSGEAVLAVKVGLSAEGIVTPSGVDPSLYLQVFNDLRESDVRMCKNIGVKPEVGAAAMTKLWGHTFSAERDHRAGPDAKPQRRGQVSRQLKAELLSVTQPNNRTT